MMMMMGRGARPRGPNIVQCVAFLCGGDVRCEYYLEV